MKKLITKIKEFFKPREKRFIVAGVVLVVAVILFTFIMSQFPVDEENMAPSVSSSSKADIAASSSPSSSEEPTSSNESSVSSASSSKDPSSVPSSSEPPSSSSAPAPQHNPNTQTYYYTRTGEKYHMINPCGNGTYYPCTLDEALDRGLEPCDKCVH